MTHCVSCRPGSPCEHHFQAQVIELAHLYGWRVAHFRPARTEKGWRTPVTADGAGWPDLILVHPVTGELLALELKSAKGKLAPAQEMWLGILQGVKVVNAFCWKPEHFPLIEAALRRKA
jgi:hypothetical protein